MNVLCTLYEGRYYEGVIALVNSLVKSDFDGAICIGSRDSPVDRVRDMMDRINEGYSDIEVRFLSVDPGMHLGRFKPFFLNRMLREIPETERLFYADPDLVVKAKWANFVQWSEFGVSICEDQNSPVYAQHPIRHVWKEIAQTNGLTWSRSLDTYFNSGYVGLHTQFADFLDMWEKTISICEEHSEIDDRFDRRETQPLDPFQTWDQDALNIAACCYGGELSFIGKEGMDFEWGGRWMSHAVGARKPWSTNYVTDALCGIAPRRVDRLYWRKFQSPFPTVDNLTIWKKRMSLNAAIFVSRYIMS
jgi:hypothetical protein